MSSLNFMQRVSIQIFKFKKWGLEFSHIWIIYKEWKSDDVSWFTAWEEVFYAYYTHDMIL
jgi:hypothetical protein